jgi:ABC-2 type transport system ATP-binding protein
VAGQLRQRSGVQNVETTAEGLRVFAATAEGLLAEIISACTPLGVRDISITEPSLETVFIQLTGRDLRE